MKLLGALLMVTGAALAQTPDLKSASGYPKMVQKQVTAWIERAAQKMPEEQYAFKPDPAVRSFGQILGHIADADYLFCSAVLGEDSSSPGIEKTKTTKAELTSALHAAFAYCNRAYDALTDANTHPYHVQVGNWIREHRGIYRLALFPAADRPDLVLWALWSRNRNEEVEGVYSHHTALRLYDLSDLSPAKLHMTVPTHFRRN